MKQLFHIPNNILFQLGALLGLTIFACGILLPNGNTGLVLVILLLLIEITGLFGSTVFALGSTLLVFFITGSTFFWFSFKQTTGFMIDISLGTILIWMMVLLVVSLVSGRISQHLRKEYKEKEALQEQIRMLVSVDAITGFDNKVRMFSEMEQEFNRCKRYGHIFTLVLIKINNFEEFKKLYGNKETHRLLKEFSKRLFQSTRVSDHKYRPESDIFGLLLTDTTPDDMQIVIQKLNKGLSVYQLTNNRYITLSLQIGYTGYTDEMTHYTEVYETAKEQVSGYVS